MVPDSNDPTRLRRLDMWRGSNHLDSSEGGSRQSGRLNRVRHAALRMFLDLLSCAMGGEILSTLGSLVFVHEIDMGIEGRRHFQV